MLVRANSNAQIARLDMEAGEEVEGNALSETAKLGRARQTRKGDGSSTGVQSSGLSFQFQ